MKKSYILVSIAVVSVLTVAAVVRAETIAIGPKASSTEDRVAKICSVVNARLDERIARFDANHERHVTAYRNLKERIVKFIERSAAKGYDVTDLEADVVALEVKIEKLATDYRAYIAVLRGSREATCGESEGVFRGKLMEARRLLAVVHQDVVDIRNYYQTTIRPDIREIKDQVPDMTRIKDKNSTTTATSTSESEVDDEDVE